MESFSTAMQDFRRARSRAAFQQLLARITGRSNQLLSYEDVRRKLHASGVVSHTLQEIPLDAIVGSVGRYNDFSRSLLPLQDTDATRWARVKVAVSDLYGLPPVEVYQIGEAYFVHDGHHRISVAKDLGATSVQAYVTEIRSKVPLSVDISPEGLILKAEYVEFLRATDLDSIDPEADLTLTCPGQFRKLLEYIEVHRYYMGIEQQREIPYAEAVEHWYRTLYQPAINIICESGIMHDFPDRTEADLYLWLSEHREAIGEALGWDVPIEEAAVDLADQHSQKWQKVAARLGRRVLDVVVPDPLEPAPAAPRRARSLSGNGSASRLFSDVLIAINGTEAGWEALEQAIEVARLEGSRLLGLHVVSEEGDMDSEAVRAIRDRFNWRCGEVHLPSRFVVEEGAVRRTIESRSRWTDLVVISLSHPPKGSTVGRLTSPIKQLIRRSYRPFMTVPGATTDLRRPLLAYNGEDRSDVALYIATYLAGRWSLPLTVVHVVESAAGEGILAEARHYLEEHGVEAQYITTEGDVVQGILNTAGNSGCNWLITGGYGTSPVLEVVKGATLDDLLVQSSIPALICQ